jgi:hypothetical protein
MEFGLDVYFLFLNIKARTYCMGLGSEALRDEVRGEGELE